MEEASIQARSKHLGFRSPFEFNLPSIQPSTLSSIQSSFAHVFPTANRQPLTPFVRGLRA